MRVYLDVSCLNRPFDDQNQSRIRLEAEAVTVILGRCASGPWEQVSSGIAVEEIAAIEDDDRRTRVRELLPPPTVIMTMSTAEFERARELGALGIKPADALHVAAAEGLGADVLLTCDDRLYRAARRHRGRIRVVVANPVDWLKECDDAVDT